MTLYDVYLTGSTREFDQPFSYLAPADSDRPAEQGCLVEVPFGRGAGTRMGYIGQVHEESEQKEFTLKRIKAVLTPPMLRSDQFELALEMRRRYFCSTGQALQLMAPPKVVSIGNKKQRCLRIKDRETVLEMLDEQAFRSLGQIRVLEFLLETEEADLQEIMSACRVSRSVSDSLRKKGLLEYVVREVKRESEPLPVFEEEPVTALNKEQKEALAAILEASPEKAPNGLAEFLLFGVTGSGKTEVYLNAAEKILEEGRDVLILVPEIALTPLICSRLTARFGDRAAVLHSRLTPTERFEQWRSIRAGEKHLVVGARSAIFAPLENIGLIVIDEEQESSYKSERMPRYHAAEIARIRAIHHRSVLLLASATPSIVSYKRTLDGKAELLRLTERAGTAVLPECRIVDMRRELGAGNRSILSRELKEDLMGCFERGEQAMIFLNRRGHSAFRLCRDCGYIPKCPDCSVSLTEHVHPGSRQRGRHALICHYCGRIENIPDRCPECGSSLFGSFGVGTQKLEEVLKELFPERRFLRMDQDTTIGRHGYTRIIEAFSKHEADCLIGTQMIAKGHDFPKVSVVGILSADLMLGMSDYAAEERAFQLICQAAGRAGRKHIRGKVCVQTYDPENPVLIAAAKQDYASFFAMESQNRRVLKYPPFAELGVLFFSSYQQQKAEQAAQTAYAKLLRMIREAGWEKLVSLYEAQTAPLARIRKKWRYRIVLKSASKEALIRLLSYFADQKQEDEVQFSCDVNPTVMA